MNRRQAAALGWRDLPPSETWTGLDKPGRLKPVRLRTYKAFSYDQAITAAKHDIGEGVRVVQTRQARKRGLIGFWSRPIFELTVQLPSDDSTSGHRPANSVEASNAYAAPVEASDEQPLDMDLERAKTRRLAQALAVKLEREGRVRSNVARNERAVAETAQLQQAIDGDTGPRGSNRKAPQGQNAPKITTPAPPKNVARRYVLQPDAGPQQRIREREALLGESAVPERRPVDVAPADAVQRAVAQAVAEERGQVGEFAPSAARDPSALRTIYARLIEQAVTEEIAEQVIAEITEELGDEQDGDPALVRCAAERRIAAMLPVDEHSFDVSVARSEGRSHVVALIGPTGVGKTTTVAKLAATCRFRDGLSVGLLTTDSFRMAAVDQLRSYAEILHVPLEVVIEPEEMGAALARLSSCDVIIVDSAGRSRRDEERLDVLREFLAVASPDETHLVLSATSGERTMLRDADAFASLGADRVVLTKLDETDDFGIVLNVINRLGTRISYVTTGQEVPDDIERGGSDRIARMLLAGVLTEKTQAPSECEPVP